MSWWSGENFLNFTWRQLRQIIYNWSYRVNSADVKHWVFLLFVKEVHVNVCRCAAVEVWRLLVDEMNDVVVNSRSVERHTVVFSLTWCAESLWWSCEAHHLHVLDLVLTLLRALEQILTSQPWVTTLSRCPQDGGERKPSTDNRSSPVA